MATDPDRLPLLDDALETALWTLAAAAAAIAVEGAAEADAFVLPTDVAADTLEAERTAVLPLPPPGGGGGWLLDEETFTFDASDLERPLALPLGAFVFSFAAADLERDLAGAFVFSLAADADLARATGMLAGAFVFSSSAARALVLTVFLTLVRNLPAFAFAFAFALGTRTASSTAAATGSSSG